MKPTNHGYHAENCVIHDDGPCTCGLEEVLQDELAEETQLVLNLEEAPNE